MKSTHILLLVAVLATTNLTLAAVPQLINYQGSLTDNAGTPLDTTVAIIFNIWPVPAGGSPDWTETHATVTVQEGLFAVQLGSVTTLPDLFAADRWLGITVGGDTEMIPRQQIISVAHAYRVGTVDGASGGTIVGDVDVNGDLRADTVRVDNAIAFSNGTTQSSAADTSGLASRVWVRSMGYLRGTSNVISATGFVGGGDFNKARGSFSVIAGGGGATAADSNSASGNYSTVGGGIRNTASGAYNTVGGGSQNEASGFFSTVSGGSSNAASIDYATVSGGNDNAASGTWATVSGGNTNSASGTYATVSGGFSNAANGAWATVSGGNDNTASDTNATVSGGRFNTASDFNATVGGGQSNTASGNNSVIGGGGGNITSGVYASVGGGQSNTASDAWATVGGGQSNTASDAWATVGGGQSNTASNGRATVSGGFGNTASASHATVAGGYTNTASGAYTTVSGGYLNTAVGIYSHAAGYRARANHIGAFVWGSSNNFTDSTASFNTYTFTARCANGARFYTAQTGVATGVQLAAGGGSWSSLCDARQKNFYGSVNTSDVLQKISVLPLQCWSYKTQSDNIQHIGPTAQDFYAAFHLGESDTTINTLDPDGVALAAIQELAKENAELKSRMAQLESQLQTYIAGEQQSLKEER